MEGGKGLAMAGVLMICAVISVLVFICIVFMIAYYKRPKSWKIVAASLINLLSILLYYIFGLYEKNLFRHSANTVIYYDLAVHFDHFQYFYQRKSVP